MQVSTRTEFKTVIAVVLVVSMNGLALADTIHVPGDYPTIQLAIDAAVDGDEIIVARGEYVENLEILNKTITIRSVGGSDRTTIVGWDEAPIVNIGASADVTLIGFKVTGGVRGAILVGERATIVACWIVDNIGPDGAAVQSHGEARIVNCVIADNWSYDESAGVYATGGQVSIVNTVIANNSATSATAIFAFNTATVRVAQTTVVDNVGDSSVVAEGSSNLTMVNSIVRGSDRPVRGARQNLDIRYSNIEGWYPGEGNIDVDPLLDASHRPLPGSPCIDAGWSTAIPGWIRVDLDLNPRVIDDPSTPNSGRGLPPIDMGAYEFQP